MRIKLFLFAVFCLYFNTAFSQSKVISDSFLTYTHLVKEQKFEAAADYLPAEMLAIIPKSQFVLSMKKVFNTPGLEFEFGDTEIKNVSPVSKIDQKNYSTIKYNSAFRMRFKDQSAADKSDSAKLNRNILKLSFEQKFGAGNVLFDEETGWYSITANKKACAISSDGKTNWKFMVLEPNQKMLAERILPKQLLTEF